MFKQIRDEVIADIAVRKEYITKSQESNRIGFALEDTDNESFTVYRNGAGIHAGLSFGIVGPSIRVIDGRGHLFLEATIGLNDSGRCLLRVGGTEIETWQFRKKALEELFFWS